MYKMANISVFGFRVLVVFCLIGRWFSVSKWIFFTYRLGVF